MLQVFYILVFRRIIIDNGSINFMKIPSEKSDLSQLILTLSGR